MASKPSPTKHSELGDRASFFDRIDWILRDVVGLARAPRNLLRQGFHLHHNYGGQDGGQGGAENAENAEI